MAEKALRIAVLLLAIMLLIIPSGVGTKADKTFRYPIMEDPGSLNPLFTTTADSLTVTVQGIGSDGGVFDNLVDQSYDGFQKREFIPRIITSWDFKNNDSTIVYHLRKGVFWHDGVELTADDMKFTYDVVMDPTSGCVQYVDMLPIWVKGYRVVDRYTFEVDLLMRDQYHFQSIYNTAAITILPDHYFKNIPMSKIGFDEKYNDKPLGYGPYKVADRQVNSYVTLEKFDQYWNKSYPKTDKVIYKVIPEVFPMWVAFKNGEVDMVGRSSRYLDEFNDYIKNKKMTTYSFPSVYFSGFRINFRDKSNPLQDRAVRQAVMYAMDRDLLCGVVLKNTSVPLKTIVTNRYPDRINPDTTQYNYDPAKSKELLVGAGYKDTNKDGYLEKDGKRLEIRYPYVGGGEEETAEWFNAMMKKVGIYAAIEQVDNGRWRQMADGADGWDIIGVGMSEASFIADHLDFWFNTEGDGNKGKAGYSNKTLDSLFESWKKTLDPVEQKKIVYEIQDVVAEDLPCLYTRQGMVVRGYNPGISQLKSTPWGMETLMMEYGWT